MKTILETLPFGTKLTARYRELLRNHGLSILAMVVLGTTTMIYFDERLVAALSGKLIASAADKVKVELDSFFQTVDSNLRTVIEQLQMTDKKDEELMEKLFFRLSPFLSQ